MNIGFDAKRAYLNNTGLGNYSRDTIRILSNFICQITTICSHPKQLKTNG